MINPNPEQLEPQPCTSYEDSTSFGTDFVEAEYVPEPDPQPSTSQNLAGFSTVLVEEAKNYFLQQELLRKENELANLKERMSFDHIKNKSIEELTEFIENRRVRMLNKQLLESGDDSSEEMIPTLPSKIGTSRKSKNSKKIAIENSKKHHEVEIINIFKEGNEKSEENLKEIDPKQSSEKCLNDDIITNLKKKNNELLRKNKILEELNISLQKEDIDKMRDISPEIEIQKQIVCHINKDYCIEEVVQMPLDFHTEPHNAEQLIKYTQNAEENKNCIIACENMEAYMDINMATNVSDGEIGASKGEKQINVGIVQNYGNIDEMLGSNSEISDDNNRDRDFDINSLTEHSDTDTYESTCETELS
ncbi:hypothetical protein JTB14_025936 [Gonioctena quinquepunctata]|nr:hypothetical protein JTB14_025936 [Gonioctena quinquepunctata]